MSIAKRCQCYYCHWRASKDDFKYNTANTEDEVRSDVRVRGFWGNRQLDAFFDFRVFYPLAPSCCSKSLKFVYMQAAFEGEEKDV